MTKPMNKIEKLIAELCPDGVEYRPLAEVFDIKNGYTPSKRKPEYWTNGTIPWFRMDDIRKNGRILSDSIQHISKEAVKGGGLFPSNSIIIATTATIGEHALVTVDSLANQQFTFLSKKMNCLVNIDMKFIFYYCYVLADWCKKNTNNSSFASVDMNKFKKFKIPIPPIAIQQEIVKILDIFTALEAELEAELEARKKQYEYYRDDLLTFGDEVEWKTLGEVCFKTENIKWKENQGIDYQYIDLSSVSRENNKISETQTINSNNAPSRAQKLIQKDDVIFATTRPTLQRYTLIDDVYDGQVASTGYCILRADEKKVLPKWIYFNIASTSFRDYVEKNQEGSAYPAISDSKVKKFKIPIPPIAEQKRIVAILDKFDALVNGGDSGSGSGMTGSLPAELKARRKQYEYYRGKLLTFKSL